MSRYLLEERCCVGVMSLVQRTRGRLLWIGQGQSSQLSGRKAGLAGSVGDRSAYGRGRLGAFPWLPQGPEEMDSEDRVSEEGGGGCPRARPGSWLCCAVLRELPSGARLHDRRHRAEESAAYPSNSREAPSVQIAGKGVT